jgi:hypothetical protein
MAMLDSMFLPGGMSAAGLLPEVNPGTAGDYPLPYEIDAAQKAREAAARRMRKNAFMEGQPDQERLAALNAGAPGMVPPAVMSAPATAPADAAATSPSPMQPAGPDSAPAVSPNATPPWLGMLNAPIDYPMPPRGPVPAAVAGAYGSDQEPAPAVPPTSALGRVAASEPESPLGRIGEAIKAMLQKGQAWAGDNRGTLMALGAGMAGSQSIGQGLNRGMTLAIPAQQQDIAQQKVNQTAKWLESKGMSPQEAAAVVNNPEMMKQVLPRLMGARNLKWTDIRKDFLGNEEKGWVDEAAGHAYDRFMRPLQPPGASGGGGGGGGAAGSGSLSDFDPSKVDDNRKGWDYLAQFPPEIQAATKAFMGGGVMPTGNPRNNSLASYAKMVAQKVAMDLGNPDLADDTKFGGRRQMVNELNKGTPGSLGGQITFGGTSLGHLATIAEGATTLGNVSGFGIAPLARWLNEARGLTTDQAAKVNEVQSGVQHYGQEITKFYTGSPGGEAERMRFLNTMNTAKSPAEIAGAIRAERALIPERQAQLEAQIRQNLGEDGLRKYPVMRGETKQAIERIDRALARLDPTGPEAKMLAGTPAGGATGGAASASPAAPSFKPKPGATYNYDSATGQFVEAK